MEELANSAFLLSFKANLIYALIGMIFFIYRYHKYKKAYQFIFAVAFPITLIASVKTPLNYVQSKELFNTVGVFEIIILIGAIAFMFYETFTAIPKLKNADTEKTDNTTEN